MKNTRYVLVGRRRKTNCHLPSVRLLRWKNTSIVLADGSSVRWQLDFSCHELGQTIPRSDYYAWDSVHNFAGVAKSCMRFCLDFCKGCKIVPAFRGRKCRVCKTLFAIRFAIMQRLQNLARDSVCTFARYAMRQTGFSLDFCRVCNEGFGNQIVIPRWGKWCPRFWMGISCLRFGWDFTPVGYLMPEIQGKVYPSGNFMPWIQFTLYPSGNIVPENQFELYHGGVCYAWDSGQTLPRWGTPHGVSDE